ncbi:hypothetical protein GCM10010172_01480 [Paractinoplanes ferrugineus]|uniref:Major facilitator superfamily (MFS) profile domain-containing protein n=1 Tax=Paractinoplanes ferrugineus TaxID=113564 RepID=A0A919MIT0_9ACTN|nr:MFS transporter [Actinoplanes ferrugineus]GIE13995.1 hypothetical protein Afe05nite_58350 [Actinoplanes ferrugineus]
MSFTSDRSRWPDVYLAAGARAFAMGGEFLAATTLALVLQQSGHGGLAVSGLLVAATLPLALFAPIGGRIADRADSRTVLVVTGLVQSLIGFALAFAHHPVAIIALTALLASGLAVTGPTLAALLPGMVRADDLAKASGLNQTAGVLGALVAPALAGILVGRTGPQVPLLLNAVSYLALVAAGLLIKTRRHPEAGPEAKQTDFRVRDDRVLTVMIVAMAATVAGVNGMNVVDVFFIRDTLHASTTMYGLVTATWAAGMLIGSVVFGRIPRARITVPAMLLVLAGSCAPLLAGALAGTVWTLFPLWFLGGAFNAAVNVFVMVIVAGRVPVAAHGRAFAAVTSSVQAAGLVGLVLAGPLVEQFDPRYLVAGTGGLGLLAALIAVPVVRRRVRSEPPRTPAARQLATIRG